MSNNPVGGLAVVTGATGGIGLAIVQRLLDAGWQVAGLDIGPAVARHAAYRHITVDLCDEAATRLALDSCKPARALVHAAGIMRVGPLAQLDPADGERMWKLHVDVAVRLAQLLTPNMAERGDGRVVLVGDAACSPDQLSGQGPTIALMGALALAGELVFTEGDHGRAFFSYEAALRHSVREAQTVAPYVVDSVAPEAGRYETWIRERAELALARGTRLMGRLGIRPPVEAVGGEFALERYAAILEG